MAIAVVSSGAAPPCGACRQLLAEYAFEAVVLTAQRPELKKTSSGFIISASGNVTQATGTATDLLRGIPSVVVDEDGNITIRGKAPLILINGRNSNLSATNRIPASSVESIEIINNPSAKYDADAEGGIIKKLFELIVKKCV